MLRIEGHRRELESHLIAASAVGSLSIVQALIAFHNREFERYGGSTFDAENLDFGFYSGENLDPKWNVIHALLTGCETEEEARRSASEAEESDREHLMENLPKISSREKSEDVEESEGGGGKGGRTEDRRVGGRGSSPSLRCVGDFWIRAAVSTRGVRAGRGSAAGAFGKIIAGVRGSRGGMTREREQILDLLLRTVLKGSQGDGDGDGDGEDRPGSVETPQTGSGQGRCRLTAPLSLFRGLFEAAHLGAVLLHTGSGSGSHSNEWPPVPVSLTPAGMYAPCVILHLSVCILYSCRVAVIFVFYSILFYSIL